MRFVTLAASGAAVALLAGCASDSTMAASAGDQGAMASATAPAAMPRTASAYATQAALSDLYEITSGQLAQSKGTSDHVKQLGATMVQHHTQTTQTLKSALPQAGVNVTPPTALDARRAAMIAELQNASGAEFDAKFLAQQKMAHQEALALHSTYAAEGDNPALKQVAATATPVIKQHIAMLQSGTHAGH
jgi:putative membrane protein